MVRSSSETQYLTSKMLLRYLSSPNEHLAHDRDLFSIGRCQRYRDSGFTLIELLTVIAIIGILAAILIPVTSAVREKAKKAQCVSNLHHIGIALIGYANDNKGRIPAGYPTEARTLSEKDPNNSSIRNPSGLGSLQYYGYISGATGVAVYDTARSRIFDCPTRIEGGWDSWKNWGDYWYNFTTGTGNYYDAAGALLYSLPEGRAIVYDIISLDMTSAIHDKGQSANVLYPNGSVKSFRKAQFKSNDRNTCFNIE